MVFPHLRRIDKKELLLYIANRVGVEKQMNKQAIIIGSGPAGLAAAVSVSRKGIRPLILERMHKPSMKLLASGGGRCNFSNLEPQEEFMCKFGRNGLFMRDALRFAPREYLLDFLISEQVKPELTDDFYYFPASGKAQDIANAFLKASGAEVRTGMEVTDIRINDNQVCGVTLANGDILNAEAVILAGGGTAWAGLGSDAGLKLAQKAGHTIQKPLPAVAPLILKETWPGRLAGVTLPNAKLRLKAGRGSLVTRGSLLFTHEGLSGFPALDLAGEAAAWCDKHGSAELILTVRDDLDAQGWQEILDRDRQNSGGHPVRTMLGDFMPRSLAKQLTELCGCSEVKTANLSASAQRQLIAMLNGVKLTVTGAGPLAKAMVMRGGISLKEVNPVNLASRLVSGLYLAGEILDLAGPCGGYNMQWAFSSGFLAGESAALQLNSNKEGKAL